MSINHDRIAKDIHIYLYARDVGDEQSKIVAARMVRQTIEDELQEARE